jgi:hypothetical protein
LNNLGDASSGVVADAAVTINVCCALVNTLQGFRLAPIYTKSRGERTFRAVGRRFEAAPEPGAEVLGALD